MPIQSGAQLSARASAARALSGVLFCCDRCAAMMCFSRDVSSAREQCRRHASLCRCPRRLGDALLQRPRIVAAGEHVEIVVAFEHQRVAAAAGSLRRSASSCRCRSARRAGARRRRRRTAPARAHRAAPGNGRDSRACRSRTRRGCRSRRRASMPREALADHLAACRTSATPECGSAPRTPARRRCGRRARA